MLQRQGDELSGHESHVVDKWAKCGGDVASQLPNKHVRASDMEPWHVSAVVRMSLCDLACPTVHLTGEMKWERLEWWIESLMQDANSPRAPEEAACCLRSVHSDVERDTAVPGKPEGQAIVVEKTSNHTQAGQGR